MKRTITEWQKILDDATSEEDPAIIRAILVDGAERMKAACRSMLVRVYPHSEWIPTRIDELDPADVAGMEEDDEGPIPS